MGDGASIDGAGLAVSEQPWPHTEMEHRVANITPQQFRLGFRKKRAESIAAHLLSSENAAK